jgi:hypothetical protein
MLYEPIVQFAGGVTAVQVSAMALDDDAVAVRPVGADGTALQLTLLVTVSTAALLVIEPAELLTVTVNCSPLLFAVVTGVVYVAAVAPEIAVPFMYH